jgi:hypothetical protein
LTGIAAVNDHDIWASGYEENAFDRNFAVPYALHWNGAAWTLKKTPNTNAEGNRLFGITAVSSSDVWLVGSVQRNDGGILSLTQHLSGTAFATVGSPSPGGSFPDDVLLAATNAGGGALFATGARSIPGQCCARSFAIRATGG